MAGKTDLAAAPNPHRGEIVVALAGRDFILLPTFEAVVAIDETLGGIIALTKRAIADPASMTLQELAVILTEGIRAKGREDGSADQHSGVDVVKKMIWGAGAFTVVPAACEFLKAAVTGGTAGKA